MLGETKLDNFELTTLSTEIKRILNDRPITDVSTDTKDVYALTPSMLLSGVVETSLPADVCSKSDLYRRSWRKGQILADRFWSRWLSEYLLMLLPRQKWFGVSPNINGGDLVLVKDDSVKRGCWPKAIVDECYPDAEELVRRVRVRTADGVLLRDIRKIYVLEGHL